MTGRELIVYILENHLEDEVIFKDGKIPGFLTKTEAALKFDVGIYTIRTWFELGALDGIKLGDEIYISATATPKIETPIL